MSKSQFNIRLPRALAERLRADARRSGRSLDAVAETIFTDFFGGWSLKERSKFYVTKTAKKSGRPIATQEAISD